MSLSRSPSPIGEGGWSSPGLSVPPNGKSARRPSPIRSSANGSAANVRWTAAQSRSDKSSTFAPITRGIGHHFRKVSAKLPLFTRDYSEKEKLGRGRWTSSSSTSSLQPKDLLAFIGRLVWKLRAFIAIIAIIILFILFLVKPTTHLYRRTGFLGGGSQIVIMLATNLGGGVMEWKGPREWAIERDSIGNKKSYADRWGYHLEKVDMSTKKRYAHEWRESWEKVDVIRDTMRKYPHAEWFWWLDLHTFIMEPSYSLQWHILNNLKVSTYRDINVYNPLNLSHPLTASYLDPESLSAIGDGKPESINLIIPQDCGGFNLGSFLIRRSQWTDRLLDIWWDPVGYEQKHMEWEHKEQDALEWMYQNQPWVRPHVAFVPQRRINSFPLGACGDKGFNPKIHYNAQDRDFLVNMAGCEWGRDCWAEMFEFRKLSERLNRNFLQKGKDSVVDWFKNRDKDKEKTKEKAKEKEKADAEAAK